MKKYILVGIMLISTTYMASAQLFSNVINTKAALILPKLDGFGNSFLGGFYADSSLLTNGQMIYGNGLNDPLIVKYDGAGNILWHKHGGGTANDKFTRLATDGQGNIYGIINFEGNLIWEGNTYPSVGMYDFLLVKYSSTGNFEWATQIGSGIDENGNYGYLDFDNNGDLHLLSIYNASSIKVNNVIQNLTVSNINYTDLKFNATTGSLISTNTFASTTNSFALGVSILHVDKNQNIYGSLYSPNAMVIAGNNMPAGHYHVKINANGSLAWSKVVQFASDRGESVAVDAQGNSIWSGDWDTQINLSDTSATQSGAVSNDIFVIKRTASGAYLWSKIWGGFQTDEAPICRINGNGNYTLIGLSGTMNVDAFALTASGNSDPYWINIAPNGTVLDVQNAHSSNGDVVFNGETASIDDLGNIIIGCGRAGAVGPANYGQYTFNTFGSDYFNLFIVGNACQATGKVYRDLNNNGQLDASDQGLPNAIVSTNVGSYYAMSGFGGNYNLATLPGNYSLSVPNVPLYHTLTTAPTQSASFAVLGDQDSLNHFGFYPTPNVRDLQISNFNVVPPKPGQIYSLVIVYKNVGTDVANGTVSLGSPSSLVNSFYANPTGTFVSTDSMNWSFTNLLPGETRTVLVYFDISTSASIGTPLLFSMTVTSTGNTETTPLDNHLNFTPLVVSSFDPNAKEVSPSFVDPSYVSAGNWFYYTIYFQNTGNDTAFNIIIRDTLNADLNIASLEQIGSSHAVSVNLRNPRVLELSYNNIQLPDSFVNEPLSHGAFQFRIKANTNAAWLHTIPNTASIYFDYNTPVQTNTANIKIDYPQSISSTLNQSAIRLYPNPASHSVNVELPSTIAGSNARIRLNDVTGRLIKEFVTTSKNTNLSVVDIPNGFYLLKIMMANHETYVQKLEIRK